MLNKTLLFFSLISLFPVIGDWAIDDKREELKRYSKNKERIESPTNCRCSDSLVLAEIFKSTSGVFWKEPWDLDTSMDSWKGVEFNNEDCVESLTLNNNGLLGFLPPELEDLSAIKKISLSGNQLQGSVPRGIANLKTLESLILSNNEYSGSIPTALGDLPNLQILNLEHNQIWGTIPNELGALANLSSLLLNDNMLHGEIPADLTKLTNLRTLDLSANELTGTIPVNIGEMSALVTLALQDNQLTGVLPVSIGNLAQLVSLRLERNRLQDSLPSNWGNLVNLETIQLRDNNLEGCFPESFELFCDLGEYNSQTNQGYSFRGNFGLSWLGDFQKFCAGDSQMEVDCAANNLMAALTHQNCTCIGAVITIPITINLLGKATCSNQNSGTINGTISPANTEFRVNWQGVGRQEDIFTSASFEIENLGVGVYEIAIFSASNDSLIDTRTINIPELDCFDIGPLSQLITPNGDGLNDAFIIDVILENPTLFKNNQLTIFNRWGDAVFEAQPYQNDWSGQRKNGQILPEGTYYYLLKIDLNEGLIYKGDITVVRK